MEQSVLDIISSSIPDLTIGNVLGSGGQKEVYTAKHEKLGDVVLKVSTPNHNAEKERAIREIQFVQNLNSTLFSKPLYYGSFDVDGKSIVYLLEEYLSGNSLRTVLEQTAPEVVGEAEVKRIIYSLLQALLLLQPHRLVHRDIKPENIMVSESRVLLIDFGIARKLDIESLIATLAIFGLMIPGYAPPEQICNEKRKISHRSDLFSLGVVAYEMLAGFNPFLMEVNRPNEAIDNVCKYDPEPLSQFGYHVSVDNFVMKCLSKSCSRRPATVELAIDLFNEIEWGE